MDWNSNPSVRERVVEAIQRSIGSMVIASVTSLDSHYWADAEAVEQGITTTVPTLIETFLVVWIVDAYTGYSMSNSVYGLALAGGGSIVLAGSTVRQSIVELDAVETKNESLLLVVQQYIGLIGLFGGFVLQLAIPILEELHIELMYIPDVEIWMYNTVLVVCVVGGMWLEGSLVELSKHVSKIVVWVLIPVVLTAGVSNVLGNYAGEIVFLMMVFLFSLYVSLKIIRPIVIRIRRIFVKHIIPAFRTEFGSS